jgi:hypothetical protein
MGGVALGRGRAKAMALQMIAMLIKIIIMRATKISEFFILLNKQK